MRVSFVHGLVLCGGFLSALGAGASCSGRPLVGSQNPNWRPVGCPQVGDPPIFVAKAEGDIFRLNPNNYGIERIGAASCPNSGPVGAMAINRRGEIILSMGDTEAGRLRVQGGANPLSTCEPVTIERGQQAPATKFSSMTFVLRDEGDLSGDDLLLWATEESELSTYLVRYTAVGQLPQSTQPLRFAGMERSDGFCVPPTMMEGIPPTCSGPRILGAIGTAPSRTVTNRAVVLMGIANNAVQLMFVDNPETGTITAIREVQGIPFDAFSRMMTATVWGDSAFVFVGRVMNPPRPDAGDSMMLPEPDYTTIHRVNLETGVAAAEVGTLPFVVRAATVPPCMRYAPGT